MGNSCCGPSAEQKAETARQNEAQRADARAKAAAAAESRLEQSNSRGMAKGSSKKYVSPPPAPHFGTRSFWHHFLAPIHRNASAVTVAALRRLENLVDSRLFMLVSNRSAYDRVNDDGDNPAARASYYD